MTSARHPLPTDIPALVSFDGHVYHNQARPLDRVGLAPKTRPLERAFEQWFSFATGKHTWVSVKGATIRGLISARQRARRSAWEVEVLINATDDESIALALFGRMSADIVRLGAERVFLRLAVDSDMRSLARTAGFFQYAGETLYRRAPSPAPGSGDVPLRPKRKADWHALWQLYNRIAPANVRAIEGLTLREWQAAREKWGGRCTDYVAETNGTIDAWVRVMPGGAGRVSVLADGLPYDALVAAGLQALGEREALCLAPDYNPELCSALDRAGFEPAERFVSFARRLTRTVEELAQETVGAVTAS